MTVVVVNPAGRRKAVPFPSRDPDVLDAFIRRLLERGFRQIVIVEPPADA